MQHRLRNRILALTLGLMVASIAGATTRSLVVEPARTRIGIARVVLNIAPLTITDEGIVGNYAIRIPLAPFMNDSGKIEIPITDLNETLVSGSTIHGTASSREDGRVHDVACTFKESKKVRIVITTPDRVLAFETPYTLNN